jgi:hypothetical protein
VSLIGTWTGILLSVIPGLLAVLAILDAIRATPRPRESTDHCASGSGRSCTAGWVAFVDRRGTIRCRC